MAHDAIDQEQVLASDWGGGRSPFAVGWPKLMMWLFLVSDTLTFAGLLAGFGGVRISLGPWPRRPPGFNLLLLGAVEFLPVLPTQSVGGGRPSAQSRVLHDGVDDT